MTWSGDLLNGGVEFVCVLFCRCFTVISFVAVVAAL